MTANGTFAKTSSSLVLAGACRGRRDIPRRPARHRLSAPGWIWLPSSPAWVAMVCIFAEDLAPFLGPVYAVLEGVALGAISKLFELNWNGIVFQAVLATIATFFVTLALYVFGIVKVTKRFQAVVIAATIGIFPSTSSGCSCRSSASTWSSGTTPRRSGSSSAS
jgi:hypothetical protein